MSGTQADAGAFPPPPGIVANFVDPPNHTRDLIALHTVCLTIATLALGIRLYSRARITHNSGWDDYTALIAWVGLDPNPKFVLFPRLTLCLQAMTVSFSAVILAAIPYGFGRHIWDIPKLSIIPMLKLGYVAEIVYLPVALSIKTAFLLFFDRVFAINNNVKTKWLVRGAIVANAAFYVAWIFRIIFLCRPIERAYNPFIPGHCSPEHVGPYTTGIWSSLSDIYILILPIYYVWNLQVKTEKKLKLTVIFSVGLFVCIASIIRLGYTFKLIDNPDVTWNLALLSLWSVLEVYVGLICSCLPALVPFFEYHFPNGFGLGVYWFRLSAFLSRSRVSTDHFGPHAIPPPSSSRGSRILVKREYNAVVVEGNYATLEEDSGNVMIGHHNIRDQAHLAQEPTYNAHAEASSKPYKSSSMMPSMKTGDMSFHMQRLS